MPKLRIIDDEILERPFDKGQFLRLLAYLKPYTKEVVFALIIMVIAALASLASPILFSYTVDEVIEAGRRELLLPMIVLFVVITLIGAVCMRYRQRLMETAGRKAIAALRQDLFNHIQKLSFSFFDTRSAGKIMVRVINDVNSLNDLVSNGIVNVIIDCLTLVIILVLMLTANWKLSLISMSVLPLIAIMVLVLKRRMRVSWQKVRLKISTMNGYLHESLSGMRVTQSFVRERVNNEIYTDINDDIRSSWMRAIRINAFFWPGLDITGTLGTVLVYIFGVMMAQNSDSGVTVGSLLLLIWYIGRFWEPINTLSNFYNSVLTAMASMERIFEILDTPIAIASPEGAQPIPPIEGRVDFNNVTFSYDAEKVVLRDVSFTVEPGQTIALVGPTGAGKSTVVNLISRFYDVTGGAVCVDGHDIRDVDLRSLRQQMSVMMQDSFIFSGTIMDNIRYGRLNATDEEVMEAAKAVGAHDFIEAMERGYKTEVNERGSRLSTGQKQLISFARALLNDPRILILDEATSSIDTPTELLIQKALERLLVGRTSFIIAHRLSTIRRASCIMVVQDGKIAESGTHDELMAQKSHYFDLCEAQYRYLE